jgi:hypothetical protein
MKNLKTRKLNRNSKISKIKCLHCFHIEVVYRNDAKYCSTLCRVQESNFRKEKGLTFLLFEGIEEKLQKFYERFSNILQINPLYKDIFEIEKIKNKNATNVIQSWKHEFQDFIMYYFVNVKSKPYQIFCNEQKYKKWKDYDQRNKLFTQKSQKFTYVEGK